MMGKMENLQEMNSEVMLKGSDNTVKFLSGGQSGGHGGNGAPGVDAIIDDFPPEPSKDEIFTNGVIYDQKHWQETECHVHHCHCDHDETYYKIEYAASACGGNGGNDGAAGY